MSSGSGFCATVVFNGVGDVRTYSNVTVLSVPSPRPPQPAARSTARARCADRQSLPERTRSDATATVHGCDGEQRDDRRLQLLGDLQGNVGATGSSASTPTPAATRIPRRECQPVHAGRLDRNDRLQRRRRDALPATATRYVVREGAVTDPLGETNPPARRRTATQPAQPRRHAGQSASRGLSYHFDFDKTIPLTAAVCPAGFALFDASGVRYGPATGSTPTISVDRRSVT